MNQQQKIEEAIHILDAKISANNGIYSESELKKLEEQKDILHTKLVEHIDDVS